VRLNSIPKTSFTIQVFADPSPDPTGYGQGKTLVDTFTVTTDATGNIAINGFVDVTVPQNLAGQYLSATATDPSGDTSEFSKAVKVAYHLQGRGQGAGVRGFLWAQVLLMAKNTSINRVPVLGLMQTMSRSAWNRVFAPAPPPRNTEASGSSRSRRMHSRCAWTSSRPCGVPILATCRPSRADRPLIHPLQF
jgi:hypothetical protein